MTKAFSLDFPWSAQAQFEWILYGGHSTGLLTRWRDANDTLKIIGKEFQKKLL